MFGWGKNRVLLIGTENFILIAFGNFFKRILSVAGKEESVYNKTSLQLRDEIFGEK